MYMWWSHDYRTMFDGGVPLWLVEHTQYSIGLYNGSVLNRVELRTSDFSYKRRCQFSSIRVSR